MAILSSYQASKRLLFDELGDDNKAHRDIWGGKTTGLMQLTETKYTWALRLYKQMRENFWIPEKVDVTNDVMNYKELTTSEQRCYKGILSYLTFLDSLQVTNLFNIREKITAPEITLCLTEQASQEGLHNHSYQVLIETVAPPTEQHQIYYFWEKDQILKERMKYISDIYQKYIDSPTDENYFYSLVANYLLEGLYFYNGFIFFYAMASRMLLGGSAEMIKYINRDELSHVRLFQSLIPYALDKFSSVISQDRIYELFNEAVNQETIWTNHIMNNDVLGITEDSTTQYTQYLADIRLKAIGLKPLFQIDKPIKSPYSHLEKFADTKGDGNVKTNYFDGVVTSYNMASTLSGWENL